MALQGFYYCECNGNDFIILLKDELLIELTDSNIQKLCRFEKESTDGLLLVDTSIDSYDFKMDYYNNDGSWETMCANGALCIIKLLQSREFLFSYNLFKAGDADHRMTFNENRFGIKMKTPEFKTEDININDIQGAHIDSGAKHFVTMIETTDHERLYTIAQEIRYDDYFKPDGLNVNFLHINDSNSIRVITYEKSIESIMKSCGSGSVAAAFYGASKQKLSSPLQISNPGGDIMIEFNSNWDDVWLYSSPSIIKESSLELA